VSEPLFPPPPPGRAPLPEKLPRPPVPREVNIAFAVWTLLALVDLVLQVLDTNGFVADSQKQMAGRAGAEMFDAGTLKVLYVVAVIFGTALMVFFAWMMRTGRKWARALLAILGIIQLMGLAITVGLTDVFAAARVLVSAAGLVFMFVAASNAYFNTVTKITQLSRRR
jgi:hypothetical protein